LKKKPAINKKIFLGTCKHSMQQKLKARVSTGTYDPACPRSHKIRKNGPPLRTALDKKDVKRNLEKEFDQEATSEILP
jgi:hypothetical protein